MSIEAPQWGIEPVPERLRVLGLADRVFGFRATWLWTLACGAVAVLLALLGPIGFVRRYVRKFAVWFVLASLGYLTWWVIDKSDLTAFWNADGKGGFPTFWQGV